MYSVGNIVVHKREGIAKIVGTKTMMDKDYFLLTLIRGVGETIYVPVESSDEIIRPVMSKESADKILKLMKDLHFEFNINTKQRRDDFKKRIVSGNIEDIVYLVRQLHDFKTSSSLPEKLKFGQMDFYLLEKARDYLFDELALAYEIDRLNVDLFIEDRIQSL